MFVVITSAVRPLVSSISAVGDAVTQLAHVNTQVWSQTLMFIRRTPRHTVMRTWERADNKSIKTVILQKCLKRILLLIASKPPGDMLKRLDSIMCHMLTLEQEFICLKCRKNILKEYFNLLASVILETVSCNNPKNAYFLTSYNRCIILCHFRSCFQTQ